ncbi:MAG: hypothetical protein K1000chlam2_01318 [Chlamydiae bacterium]|nr:hypothetical protein [Chlamydiota bacterium]
MSVSKVSEWIRPSTLTDEIGSYVTTRSGAKDTLEAIINAFDWMAHLEINQSFAKKTSGELELVKQGLAVPGFFSELNTMRREIQHWSNSDDPDATRRVISSALLCVVQGSESVQFLDASKIYHIGKAMKPVLTAFWGALFLLGGGGFFWQIGRAETLNKEIDETKNLEYKNILKHKVQHAYLSVLQNVTMIAMASICLISILFSSMAQGFIFNPVVMIGLGSAWLMLEFVTYFYDKMIDHWDKELKIF